MSQASPLLIAGAALFAVGLYSALTRRNLIVIVLSVELMLQGVMAILVAFSRLHGSNDGLVFGVAILTVAACEAAIALALVLNMYRTNKTLDVEAWSLLGENPPAERADEVIAPAPEPAATYPHLAEAGREPKAPRPVGGTEVASRG